MECGVWGLAVWSGSTDVTGTTGGGVLHMEAGVLCSTTCGLGPLRRKVVTHCFGEGGKPHIKLLGNTGTGLCIPSYRTSKSTYLFWMKGR